MKRTLSLFAVLAAALTCNPAMAETRRVDRGEAEPPIASPTMTPEMWLYLQEMRRYDDPQTMIRRRAEQRAAQRQLRIAARKWFGHSLSRPQANPVPFYSTYSPYWTGGSWDPFAWQGSASRAVAGSLSD